MTLEAYFAVFRDQIIGNEQTFEPPYGEKKILYADWTASGRAYAPIEAFLQTRILPFAANTHTSSTATSAVISKAYEQAKLTIKAHVNASKDDVLLFCGSGMTAAVNKLQRILGMRVPERLNDYLKKGTLFAEIDERLRPIVFITDMEHHSNHTSWLETIATVEIIRSDSSGNVDLEHFSQLLKQYQLHHYKIAAITACSNVTGIETPYRQVSKMIHRQGGWCFVDFACSAPYVTINMHPAEKDEYLDAIYFSAHKFLGGPGTPGILVFNKDLYSNKVPDQPGGGTISYSNPWKVHEYVADIELREDGGTPPILQGIKAALCIDLKEAMGVERIRKREKQLLEICFERFKLMKNIIVLERATTDRLAVISFIIEDSHYNLIVKLLNDCFGIQTRGGCSCASTYGHRLLQVSERKSTEILKSIRSGNLLAKPGWIRLSLHPTMTDAEINYIMDAIEAISINFRDWAKNYCYEHDTNEFIFIQKI
jgi:selenocysteine lyase/cysteine desulfurase